MVCPECNDDEGDLCKGCGLCCWCCGDDDGCNEEEDDDEEWEIETDDDE